MRGQTHFAKSLYRELRAGLEQDARLSDHSCVATANQQPIRAVFRATRVTTFCQIISAYLFAAMTCVKTG